MITMAEKEGRIKPGCTIIEATAGILNFLQHLLVLSTVLLISFVGNTGIGLIYMANSRGYKCLFTLPASTSNEKVNLLRKLGAQVEICPSVGLDHPDNFHNA